MFEIPDSMDFFQKKIGCNSKPLINFKFINFCRNVGGNPGIKIISAGLFISAMCQSNRFTAWTCKHGQIMSREPSGDLCNLSQLLNDIVHFCDHWSTMTGITRLRSGFRRKLTRSKHICVCIQFKARRTTGRLQTIRNLSWPKSKEKILTSLLTATTMKINSKYC